MPDYLLAAEFLLITLGTRQLFMQDRLAGIYFLFLGIYAIPAQIGYLYLPELSELIQAYFGEDVWLTATQFIILSMFAFFVAFKYGRNAILTHLPFHLSIKPRKTARVPLWIGTALIVAILAYDACYLLLNFSDISWQTAQEDEVTGASPGYFLFLTLFKQMVGVCLILYAALRQESTLIRKWPLRGLSLVAFALFLFIAVKLGNRTDLVAITLGIVTYETAKSRIDAKFLLRVGAALCIVVFLLIVVEVSRSQNESEATGLTVAILTKDYYAPAHMLFAAISFDFVQPLTVIWSNTANALVKLNVPYLQATVTDLFRPDLATRSAGYAFYVLTEGFIFMGMLGFIYNGIILTLGIAFWRKLASTNSREFNLFMMALLGSMIVNVVRGQTSYFFKYSYTFLLPGMLIYCSIMGKTLTLKLQRSSPNSIAGVL
jgi:hypothetical protein